MNVIILFCVSLSAISKLHPSAQCVVDDVVTVTDFELVQVKRDVYAEYAAV